MDTEQPRNGPRSINIVSDHDDIDLAMVCIAVITIVTSFILKDPTAVIFAALTGIAALAKGRKKGN